MKLRTKLWISFSGIIIVPIILVILCAKVLVVYQLNVINKTYNIESSVDDIFPNPTKLFNRLTGEIQKTIQEKIQQNPDMFQDSAALDELSAELKRKNTAFIVRKNNQIIYSSNDSLTEIYNQLPDYGESDNEIMNGHYLGGKEGRLVKVQDFQFTDGSQATVFIVMSLNNWIPELKTMYIQLIGAVIVVLILTATICSYWIYRSILRPLNKLKIATKNIKEGNLDFVIEADEHDEIGQLCVGFEEMRQRLKENAEEKIQFDAESKELISNISHDLKTPITAIKGYVEGIMDGVADTPEKMNRYIQTIYNKANDMDRLINELTFYSKIDTNRIPYTFSKINVADYFRDCAEEVGMDLESKNILFSYYNYCDESVIVIADAEQMKRVINNIISNSVKYMDKSQGKINMRIKDVGDFIQVEIEDNGKGIGQKEIPYIFDRFYRTDSSRNSAQGGSGIGLSIVKKIIEDHGGKIWASSKEGTGTVMNFVLRKYQEVHNE
ncbi:MAG: HAMP domain-containing histidine kinase [Clostridiales bacterium]|nr:HAMP domain-containing histidine kinase [Clostridiales bacterium]